MPCANIVAIVTLGRVTGCFTKILEMAGSLCVGIGTIRAAIGQILMISDHRPCDRLYLTPAQIVGLEECLIASAIILIVTQSQDGRKVLIGQEFRCIFLAAIF